MSWVNEVSPFESPLGVLVVPVWALELQPIQHNLFTKHDSRSAS